MKATIEDRLKGGPAVKKASGAKSSSYSVQLGAFTNQQRAQAAADRARNKAQSLSLGSPRLIESTSKGKKVVLVQVGKFGSKKAAESAKAKLGENAFVTASAD
jgi:cell division septation protein DedD